MANIKTLELKIPNLGDAESTEIIEVNVKVGDKISINDPLIVLESEKAAMEVPSDFAGEISELLVSEGENVSEGQIYAKIIAEENLDHKQIAETEKVTSEKTESQETEAEISNVAYDFSGINAGPAVRKYARELEIDLAKITGSGKNSRITKDDLKNFIHSSKQTDSMSQLPLASDFEEFGSYEVLKLSKIRALGAKNLASAWTAIPHVTHFEEIDLSKINELRNVSKLSPLSYLVKCIANNLLEFKEFNASLLQNDEILLKNYINMGIAVDTPNGLVVPVIKNANKLSIEEINSTIKTLAEKAINKKLLSKDLIGATFTVSSLGKIGGVGFTPIINSPEVAIIGISRTKKVLKMQDQKVREVDILPISLSYDHRVINGADAGRFMDNLKNMIENYSE